MSSQHTDLVVFNAGSAQAAIEARHVMSMSGAKSSARTISAEALLLGVASSREPSQWLTLRDSRGPWQLGINGNVALSQLPTSALFPLPPLLASRHASSALCGLALAEQTLLLLFDGAALSPGASN